VLVEILEENQISPISFELQFAMKNKDRELSKLPKEGLKGPREMILLMIQTIPNPAPGTTLDAVEVFQEDVEIRTPIAIGVTEENVDRDRRRRRRNPGRSLEIRTRTPIRKPITMMIDVNDADEDADRGTLTPKVLQIRTSLLAPTMKEFQTTCQTDGTCDSSQDHGLKSLSRQ
jgi:hypothetical protein